jgi:4'-phosphopantetheinyl transferase EntD
VIGEILPAAAAWAEAFDDAGDEPLFGEEEAIVARAVSSRRRAFATGRACARRALADLGLPPLAIPRDEESGAPLWPAGVVGAITHCEGYGAAVVAWSRDLRSLGIDAEPDEPLPDGVLPRVASADERALLESMASAEPGVSWDRLLFSAKEATYKAWFPPARRWLGFEDAVVTIDPAAGTFTSRLLVPAPLVSGGRELTGFEGRWLAREGLVVTAVAVPA